MRFPKRKNGKKSPQRVFGGTDNGVRGERKLMALSVLGALLLVTALFFLSGCEENSPFYQDLERIVEEYEAEQGGDDGGDGGDDSGTPVVFQSAVQTGGTSGTVDSTGLTLTFDVDPTTLAASDITVTGATKGTLSGTDTTRSLTISGITVGNGETVSVAIASPSGYTISGSPKTAVVYREHSQAYFDLQALIQSSQSKHDGAIEGTTVGDYRSGSKASFQTEIDNATTVLNDPASTDPDYDTARATLTTANTTFDSQIVTDLDVFIFVDITGSMGSALFGINPELVTIIQDIDSRNSDARYAVIASNGPSGLIEPTGGFDNSFQAINAINGLSAGGVGEILVTSAIQTATENYTWTAGSDRIAIFITDSLYVEPPNFTDAQNMLTSNNIISVACVNSDSNFLDAQALFAGSYNGISGLSPAADVAYPIRSVLQNNIAYW